MPAIENLQSGKETDRCMKGRKNVVCVRQREKSSAADVGHRAANSRGTVPGLSGEEEELGGLQGSGCCRERKCTKTSLHVEAYLAFRSKGAVQGGSISEASGGLTRDESLFVREFEFHLIGNSVNWISS